MKRFIAITLSVMSYACIAGGITTNILVYTNISKPWGTFDLFAEKLNIVISNGLVVTCQSEGRYDLINGLPEKEALEKDTLRQEMLRRKAKTNQTVRLLKHQGGNNSSADSLRARRALRDAEREKEAAEAAKRQTEEKAAREKAQAKLWAGHEEQRRELERLRDELKKQREENAKTREEARRAAEGE